MIPRACIVVQNYYETDPRVQREAKALAESGWYVDILALRSSNFPQNSYVANNIHVSTLSVGKKRAGKLSYLAEYLLFFILASSWLAYQTFRKRYQLVHICTLPDFLVFAALIPKLFGTKVLLDMHEVMPEFYMSKFRVHESRLSIRLIKLQEKLSILFADHVITVNQPILEMLTGRGLKLSKVTSVMNLPDEGIFSSRADFTWPRSLPPSFKLIYTGTLGERHGVQTAIKGLSYLIDDIPGIQLQIVGDGDYKPDLVELAHSLNLDHYVSFDPPIPLKDIPDLLLIADVGICLQEGLFCDIAFPTKVPEYISMNLPVVVSDNKITRLYFDSTLVVFVPPADPLAFAEAIRAIYLNPASTNTIIKKAQHLSEKLNWETEKEKYLNAINSLVSV